MATSQKSQDAIDASLIVDSTWSQTDPFCFSLSEWQAPVSEESPRRAVGVVPPPPPPPRALRARGDPPTPNQNQ